MNRPNTSTAKGRVPHRMLLLVIALTAAGAAHHHLVTIAHASCPWPDSQLCGLGPKVFEADTCGAQASQLMPIPGTWRSFGEPPQQQWTWLKATSLSLPAGPADNQVIGTHSHVTFKTLDVLDVPLWNNETHYWDLPASVIYVLRQDLLYAGQAAAAIFARRPSTFVPAQGLHPAHHRTYLTAVAYYPGAGHGKITRKVFHVNDAGDDFDELDLMFRLRARAACIYAYHTPQFPECRYVSDLYWEFIWAHENDWGPSGSQRYNHDGTENSIRFHLGPERIFPVIDAYHGVEMVGTGEPHARLHIGSDNNRKYYFSACNCLDHCQTIHPQPCGCIPDPENGWQASFPDNIPAWGDLSGSPIEVGMDVFAPDKWMLPDPDNDPSDAVFEVCYNDVPNTPCSYGGLEVSRWPPVLCGGCTAALTASGQRADDTEWSVTQPKPYVSAPTPPVGRTAVVAAASATALPPPPRAWDVLVHNRWDELILHARATGYCHGAHDDVDIAVWRPPRNEHRALGFTLLEDGLAGRDLGCTVRFVQSLRTEVARQRDSRFATPCVRDGWPGNAFEHAYLICRLAQECGHDSAWQHGLAHEEYSENPCYMAAIDLHNNAVGLRLWEAIGDEGDCSSAVIDALVNGELVFTTRDDADPAETPPPGGCETVVSSPLPPICAPTPLSP